VVELLLILDGASEPLGDAPASLERARTPALDRLAREGELSRVRTVAPWLPAGSESAIPALLGWVPDAPLDRGALEAAARGIELAAGERAWRVDALGPGGRRADDGLAAAAARQLEALLPHHAVRRLGGHRLLVRGPAHLPALPAGLRAWPEGELPPVVLDETTVVIAAPGAAAGVARLMGARVVVPAGATGRADTDMAAKARAAGDALGDAAPDRAAPDALGAPARVVVHLGAPDEAAHERDPAAKVAALERADRELVEPLARLAFEHAAALTVCPDHGCDPRTGEHHAAPVPSLRWTPAARGDAPGARLTERAVASLPVADLARQAVPA
jgi:2,3-bisphosphoglycerate-independent phosphoglycerate mutase